MIMLGCVVQVARAYTNTTSTVLYWKNNIKVLTRSHNSISFNPNDIRGAHYIPNLKKNVQPTFAFFLVLFFFFVFRTSNKNFLNLQMCTQIWLKFDTFVDIHRWLLIPILMKIRLGSSEVQLIIHIVKLSCRQLSFTVQLQSFHPVDCLASVKLGNFVTCNNETQVNLQK